VKTEIGKVTISGSHPAFNLIILVFIITGSNLFSQNIQSKASRQSSINAFINGDYEKASGEFAELLIIFPKDPLYKYYSGVCLIKLNRNAEEAASLLREAQQGASVVRTIPSDAAFWLGRAQQLSGDFIGALDSYNLFTEKAGRKAAKELDVSDFIRQCKAKMNQTSESGNSAISSPRENEPSSEPVGKIVFQVKGAGNDESKIASGIETLPVDLDILLSEALDYQNKADSVYRIAREQNSRLEKLDYRGKTDLRVKIKETEDLAESFQKIADRKYAEAQTKMNAVPFTGENTINQKNLFSAGSVNNLNDDKVFPEREIVDRKDTFKVIQDTLKKKENVKKLTEQVKKVPDEGQTIKKEIPKPVKAQREIYALFEENVKPSGKPDEKVVIGSEIPEGLIYRIQIAVFRNPVAISYFKGLRPVNGFRIPGTDKTNYYVGMFRRQTDAKKALLTVRQKGFKDAFIVSFFSGKTVSAERAAVIEKEWGKKPITGGLAIGQGVPSDTIPPALSFRVEVTRAAKPLKDEILEGMKKMAGARGLNSEKLADGIIVYLIGEFITYESAEDFADLLVRNGYRDAKVAAWLGTKEIPVETAKQLFERIE